MTTSDVNRLFAEQLRTERGMSRRDVAAAMKMRGFDMPSTTIGKIERGERRVNLAEAAELTNVVGMRIEAFLYPVPNKDAIASADVVTGDCLLCDEQVIDGDDARQLASGQWAHRECLLRSVMGGIGHLENHALWCLERGDPDGGRTFRQSALEVDQWMVENS